jgi:hypothetical protein
MLQLAEHVSDGDPPKTECVNVVALVHGAVQEAFGSSAGNGQLRAAHDGAFSVSLRRVTRAPLEKIPFS